MIKRQVGTICVVFGTILVLVGCAGPKISPDSGKPPLIGNLSHVTLITGGYGYEVGDIVLLDTVKKPDVGDVVQYNWNINKTSCMGMGPSLYLAKIVGLPGDMVTCEEWSYEANGFHITLERYYQANNTTYEQWPETRGVVWGDNWFENIAGMKLEVPEGEYLADRWIGYDCSAVAKENATGQARNRFTVKQEAITGVVVQKLGHDKKFEEEQKQIVY